MASWFTTIARMGQIRIILLAVGLSLILSQMIHAQAQDRCAQAIVEAETQYVEGRFGEVVGTLAPCMNRDDILIEHAVAAYRLRALSFIRRGDVEEARLAIIELLSREPEYEPDPIRDIPSYVALVELVRRELQLDVPTPVAGEPAVDDLPQEPRRSWFRSNRGWLIAGGSAALVGIITAVAASGGGGTPGPTTLPGPPVMPD